MTDSQKLLAEYAVNGSESAFRELVTRYISLVYSTALRLVGGDTQLAEDVTQTVFIGLAKKGRTLSREVMLGGWLHQHAYHVATKAVRSERRRQTREREAVEMNMLQDDSGANLRQVAPILDEAITQLGSEDRTAILLRFFEQRDFRSVGEALGSNEDAARMRVNRALEKLHSLLRHRGVTLSIAALGTVLTAEAVTAAPVGLAATVSTAVLGGTTVAATTTATITKAIAMTTLQKTLITATIVVASLTAIMVTQHQSQVSLRKENESLRQQIAQLTANNENPSKHVAQAKGAHTTPRLPAPPMQATAQPNASPMEDLQSTNLIAQLTKKDLKLTVEQVKSYLKANRRNAASLLAAYRTTGNPALLEEAMQQYPNDPQVAFEAAFKMDASPAERRQWLDAFKQSDPDNALADYLSAFNYFKAGQTDQAVQELIVADGKPQFQDYLMDRVQDDEDAYLAAGYPVAEAKALGTYQVSLPYLRPLRDLGRDDLVNLANSYRQAGDEASAQAALQMAVNLGQRYENGSPGGILLSQFVGMAVERSALGAMDPNSPYGNNGQTAQDRLNQLAQQTAALKGLAQQAEPLVETMSDQDWISYTDRIKSFGHEAALRWLVNKNGQK
jgi:RNA polymerase sigma factor (sigma-70 family)